MRIVLTGGGTGGHAYPAISIAEALRAAFPSCQLLYIGSKDGPEARLASEAGIPFSVLTTRKLSRRIAPEIVLTVAALLKGLWEALAALREFKPDLVVGTGGYAAAAVVLAQALRRGKTLIHEQNLVPGRTNLWLGRFASKVCITFADSARYFPAGKTVVTGLPIRSNLLNLPGKEEARADLGLDPRLFTVLVLGGSQGARRINRVVAEAIPMLSRLPMQVLHQVGERNLDEAEEIEKSTGWDGYHMQAYFDDMRPAYGAADLVVSRSGASTIAEITAVGLPAIYVPYPHAYADHQRLNAELVAHSGGGVVIDESGLSAASIADAVEQLMALPEELRVMAEASRSLGRPNAAGDIAVLAGRLVCQQGARGRE